MRIPRSQRPVRPVCLLAAAMVALLGASRARAQEAPEPAVVVYGATPAGIAASLAAASEGAAVLLVEPNHRVGGMVTNGLSHTDFRTSEGLTGTFLRFTERVADHYRWSYGETSPQARMSFRGTQAEPGVNLSVFEPMLTEWQTVQLRREWTRAVVRREESGTRNRFVAAVFTDGSGRSHEIPARVFVDATYEGDLMAAAGVQWWASAGGLHSLHSAPEQPGARGRLIEGQYFEAYPGHAAELGLPLDPATRLRWEAVARELGIAAADLPDAGRRLTRGEWLRLVRGRSRTR